MDSLNSQTKCNTLIWLKGCCDGTKVYAVGGGGAVRDCPSAPSRGNDPANRGKSGSRAIKHCSGAKTQCFITRLCADVCPTAGADAALDREQVAARRGFAGRRVEPVGGGRFAASGGRSA